MKPAGLIPPYFPADETGQLLIGGDRAEDIVDRAGGTPVFVYDNNIVGAQIARFRAAMADGISLYYSVTANPYEPLLEFVGKYVDGFRVVSLGELNRLRKAKLAGIPINFAGPGKSDLELEAAVRAGATISIESEGEARRTIAAAEKVGDIPKISVRVTPPFTLAGEPIALITSASAFGVDRTRVPALIAGLIEAGANWRGLHIFSGVQCLDADALARIHRLSVDYAAELAAEIGAPIPELNLGGGFEVACRAGDEPLDIDKVARALTDTLCTTPQLLATTRVTIELGRWLVGECGVYLTRVIDRTEIRGKVFLTTDGGGHHLIRATGNLGEQSTANPPVAIATCYSAPSLEEVTIRGCLCTPFDVFGEELMLPRADVGDLVAVFCAGAYGPSASPQAWESRPAAVELLV